MKKKSYPIQNFQSHSKIHWNKKYFVDFKSIIKIQIKLIEIVILNIIVNFILLILLCILWVLARYKHIHKNNK
jgi:hypothetical protein